jgi:hypothetical protein
MTSRAGGFTNYQSFTLITHSATFDVASAIDSDYACTNTELVITQDWGLYTQTFCQDYTEKPTASATSIAYRTAAAPFPPDGVIAMSDVGLYDLYHIFGMPSATTSISVAPNVTVIETSATPFVHFTAYEVESGNSTSTVHLPSAYVYPYRLVDVDNDVNATGPLPEEFLQHIPQSDCVSGQLQAVVTVVIVVDLYYESENSDSPFIIHFESSALGFDEPPISINRFGPSSPESATMNDWDMPDLPIKSAVPEIKPSNRLGPLATGTQAGNRNNQGAGSNENAPQPAHVTVGAVGTVPVVVGPSSVIVVGDQTLHPGGPAIIVGGVTPVSLAPGATVIVVAGSTSQLPQVLLPALGPARAPPVLTIGSSTLTPNAATQFFVAPGQTLTPGGTATIDGTVVSLASAASFIVIGTSTRLLPFAGPVATITPHIVVHGTTITALPSQTTSGTPQDNPKHLGANPQAEPEPGPTFVIGGQTLTPGGPPITVSGTTLSLAPGGSSVIVNGVPSAIPTPITLAQPTLTIGDSVFTQVPGSDNAFLIAGQTLVPGGQPITMSGTTISLSPGATALVINGQTSQFAPARVVTNAPLLTIGSATYTAISGTTFIIGGQTLTPGGVVTVEGTTIRLEAGATQLVVGSVGSSTSVVLFPATVTRSATGSADVGESGRSGQAAVTSQRREGTACVLSGNKWTFAFVVSILGVMFA